jgi:hypothetical protein
VLLSAPTVLRSALYIYTEVSLIETYKGVMLWPEFRRRLEDYGYKVVAEDLQWSDMGNVLLRNTLCQ